MRAAAGRAWLLALALAAVGPTVAGTPGLIVAAATASTLVWVALVLLGARGSRLSPAVAVAALLGGALVAPLVEVVNTLAAAHAMERVAVAVVVGPPLEEAAKALPLLLLMALQPAIRGPRGGLVAGALVGLGFAWSENLHYLTLAAVQGGIEGLGQALVVRGVLGGPSHALFTATTGVGLGWGALATGWPRRLSAAAAGVAAATALHVAWNGLVSVTVMRLLCGPGFPDTGCPVPPRLLPPPAALLVVAAFFGPLLVLLVLAARRGSSRA